MAQSVSKRTAEYTDCISANKYPGYDTKQSNGEAPVMQEFLGMWSTPLLLSLSGPLWLGVVAFDRVLCTGKIELNSLLMLKWIV